MLLDKSRPYGTITGKHPARYYQDGKHFDAKGVLMSEEGEPVEGRGEQGPPANEPQTISASLVGIAGQDPEIPPITPPTPPNVPVPQNVSAPKATRPRKPRSAKAQPAPAAQMKEFGGGKTAQDRANEPQSFEPEAE